MNAVEETDLSFVETQLSLMISGFLIIHRLPVSTFSHLSLGDYSCPRNIYTAAAVNYRTTNDNSKHLPSNSATG
jgi:hypothetical protein